MRLIVPDALRSPLAARRSPTSTCPESDPVNRNSLYQLAAFVVILLLLNAVFALHISIIGSVVLTLVLSFAFNAMRRP